MSIVSESIQRDAVPPITNKMGNGWSQPNPAHIAIDAHRATMTRTAFKGLSNYESSMPSGVYAGKMWRRGNLLLWYGTEFKDAQGFEVCPVHFRPIVILG